MGGRGKWSSSATSISEEQRIAEIEKEIAGYEEQIKALDKEIDQYDDVLVKLAQDYRSSYSMEKPSGDETLQQKYFAKLSESQKLESQRRDLLNKQLKARDKLPKKEVPEKGWFINMFGEYTLVGHEGDNNTTTWERAMARQEREFNRRWDSSHPGHESWRNF